jgi:predicted phage terminase large subunit-like protein
VGVKSFTRYFFIFAGMVNLEQVRQELARRNLIDFITYTMPTYERKWFHEYTAKKITDWAKGNGKPRLMVFMPPQHGKSQLSTRHAPAWVLGNDPSKKVAIAAYNAGLASRFNRDVQRIIDSPEYKSLYPECKLPAPGIDSGNHARNNTEFEIINKGGSLISVGVGGGLTGRQVDVMIIDDVYKDAQEAWSTVQRANVSEWYGSVVETRLNNDSKVLIVFTRWHEDDLGGELLAKEPDKWDVVKFPALATNPANQIDPRNVGDALWPEKHSREKIEGIRARNPIVFENLYQQDPQPAQGLLYSPFKTYKKDLLPVGVNQMYCDSADTGSDYTCAIYYTEYEGLKYVTDVVYSQDKVEITEPLLASALIANQTNQATIEANAGGRIFARNVERVYRTNGGTSCTFKTFTQRDNKEARINANASLVNELILMPENWHDRWPLFYQHVTRFNAVMKKNTHDDCADALTGIVERTTKYSGTYATART